MTREDLNGKSFAEVEPMLDQEFNDYKTTVDSMMTMDEILDAEDKLMTEAQEYDSYLDSVEYDLPNGADYGGKHYSRNDIAKVIITSLNKLEVEWSQTLGLFELVELWRKKDLTKMPNKAYDSTLRVLNQVKYKGYDEWRDILATNVFLSGCHNSYQLDTGWNVLISEKHNYLMQRAELVRKDNNVIDEQEVVMGGPDM